MDKSITYRDLDEMSLALGAYLQSKGLQKGARVALMMPNVLQYPVSTAAVLRAGYRGRERQSALHPARARTPAQGFRRRGHYRSRKLRDHRAAGDGQDLAQARHRRQHGRSARLQGRDRQSGGAAREENGAALFDSARGRLQRRRRGRPQHEAQQAQDHARRRRLPAIYRRHHRRLQGRDAAPPQHSRQRAAERRLAAAGAEEATAGRRAFDRLRAAALSHLRADGVFPAGDARRRHQSADSQSARHGGFRQGIDEIPGQLLPGGQHALQRPVAYARFRQGRFLQAEGCKRRRHGDAKTGRREVAGGDRLRARRKATACRRPRRR